MPVAEEAAVTARMMGNEVLRLYDVGVAGIHRVLDRRQSLSAPHKLYLVGRAWAVGRLGALRG